MSDIFAMIPCAGRGSRMLSLTDDNPKAMLPLHNKPIIGWHLDKLLEEGIKNVCIIVGYKKEKLINYVDKFYGNQMNIIYAEQTELKGLAHAIQMGINEIKKQISSNTKLLIILGDTIIKDDLSSLLLSSILHQDSFVGYKQVDDYKRWCLLETDDKENIKGFIDKPDTDPGTRKAVIGIYYFDDLFLLDKSICSIIDKNIKIKNEYQLSSAMEEYLVEKTIKGIEFKEWFDCGEVESFNNTRKNITRHFNSIEVTDDNTIKKKSKNEKKIQQEINWFLNIPNKLRVFVPQLIDYSILKGKTFYEIEYINFTPMQELFLYNLPDLPEWEKFFANIFYMVEKFNINSTKARFNSTEHLHDMLVTKTKDRLLELKQQDEYWSILFQKEKIFINGTEYKNLPLILESLFSYINTDVVANSAQFWQIIHGDLFFGNMLYDVHSDTLKIIDPRGNFGLDGIYGDIRYDLAKLNHSVVGKYDFIVNDLYALTERNYNYDYILYDSPRHNEIEKIFINYIDKNGFNYKHVMAITGLLFLSMIPLHAENFNNQKMFYLKAIEIFNQII
jgi:dTDP-glucose pyrophosphorylase